MFGTAVDSDSPPCAHIVLTIPAKDTFRAPRKSFSLLDTISIDDPNGATSLSETTLYRDLKENKLSSTTDAKGKKVIDTAELERFYGQLKSPSLNGAGNNGISQSDPTEQNGTHGKPETDTSEHNGTRYGHPAVIAVLEDQVTVLKSQLESEREEKVKRLDMLAIEQEKTKLLMLPQAEAEPAQTKRNWLFFSAETVDFCEKGFCFSHFS